MESLLLYFLTIYLLKVSSAKMAVCKTIASNKDHHESLIFIEKNNSLKGQKGENGTKGEKGDKGKKGDIGQINQTEIIELKHKITG